jgi:hypothetical protein
MVWLYNMSNVKDLELKNIKKIRVKGFLIALTIILQLQQKNQEKAIIQETMKYSYIQICI